MLRVQKLIDDLDYWIFIGIGDDIVSIPSQRSEYQHLVALARDRGIRSDLIPKFALRVLKLEQKHHPIFQRTQRRLFWMWLKDVFS